MAESRLGGGKKGVRIIVALCASFIVQEAVFNGQRTKVPFISRNSPYGVGRLARYSIPPVAHIRQGLPCTHARTHTRARSRIVSRYAHVHARGAECGAINTRGETERPTLGHHEGDIFTDVCVCVCVHSLVRARARASDSWFHEWKPFVFQSSSHIR